MNSTSYTRMGFLQAFENYQANSLLCKKVATGFISLPTLSTIPKNFIKQDRFNKIMEVSDKTQVKGNSVVPINYSFIAFMRAI